MLPSLDCSDRRYASGRLPGLRPTATSPCTAHAVDCEFDPCERICPNPPSECRARRRYATARFTAFDPRRPAAPIACRAAPVSSAVLAAWGWKPKPPSAFCRRASQLADRLTLAPPAALSDRIPKEVHVLLFDHDPLRDRRPISSATRSRPANERTETPAARSVRTARSRSPVSFSPPACART